MAEGPEPRHLEATEALGAAPVFGGPAVPSVQPCLLLLTGAHKGALYPLQEGGHVLGRSPAEADILLDGARGVSRTHARVDVLPDGTVAVADLDSTNGVFLNDQKVSQATLEDGDRLALGPEVLFRLEFRDPPMQQLMEEMYRSANLDPLTGLLNRRSFLQRLEEEHAAARRHRFTSCVAMLDLDHFKSVNDTYGHPAGDAVLVELTRRLVDGMRQEDVVGRFGGEEFVLLIRSAPLQGALTLVERLRERMAQEVVAVPTPSGQQKVRVTFSAGLARLEAYDSVTLALEKADQALYEAKQNGRNRVAVPR